LQADKSGFTLLPPCSLLGKADLETAAAKPKEDGCCGNRPSFLGSACIQKAFATSGLLVKKPLTTGGLLAIVGGLLVKELLTMGGLLAFVGGTLVKESVDATTILPSSRARLTLESEILNKL
jgi:hypothetical protein